MRKRILVPLIAVFTLIASGCGPGMGDVQGSSSGGGGFAGEEAVKNLERASAKLAKILRILEPRSFVNLPEGWSQERIAKIIENVRHYRTVSKVRHGIELVMDYGIDEASGEPYIAARRKFFSDYDKIIVSFEADAESYDLLKSIYRRLLHEVAHHVYSHAEREHSKPEVVDQIEVEAKWFADSILEMIDHDMLLCKTNEDTGDWPLADNVAVLEPIEGHDMVCKEFDYDIYRASGKDKIRKYLTDEEFAERCDMVKLDSVKKTHTYLISRVNGYSLLSQEAKGVKNTDVFLCENVKNGQFKADLSDLLPLGLKSILFEDRFAIERPCQGLMVEDFELSEFEMGSYIHYKGIKRSVGNVVSRADKQSLVETLRVDLSNDENIKATLSYKGSVPFVEGSFHNFLWRHRQPFGHPVDEPYQPDSSDRRRYSPGQKKIYMDGIWALREKYKAPDTPVSGEFELQCEASYRTFDFSKILGRI